MFKTYKISIQELIIIIKNFNFGVDTYKILIQ